MSTVRRFWIEFDLEHDSDSWIALDQGVGVTGFDEQDCLSMVADLLPADTELPPVRRITVDISLAEPLPVNPPTLGVPVWRGVWYPPRNLSTGPMWRPRGVDRTAERPGYPTPVTGTSPTWWDEIPHIKRLLLPLAYMHDPKFDDQKWKDLTWMERARSAADPTYAAMVREALDYVIARRPTPSEWYDPTNAWFLDQQELDEYLRALRDYLFGDRSEPISPPGNKRPLPDVGTTLDDQARDSGGQEVL
ncbi:hypothetical protein [Nocardia abscessus]|uniref:hypothetical protein n=1 Tax=Nocardia abscessus TaxID=120957 RepID=UPI0005BC59A8|nr:hypothetical protein [Nocardia abscessus]MCC3333007.1 hypothetical protein [Nocardia abscessus]